MTDDIQSIGDLRALGSYLNRARESRALALDEVERQTRIRAKYLSAIEAGDYSILPSAAHAKGFLRNYALFLQLDADALVMRFSELTGYQITPVTSVTAPPRPEAPPPSSTSTTPAAPQSTPSSDPQPPGGPPSPYPTRSSTYVTPAQRVGPTVPAGLGQSQPRTPSTPAPVQTAPTRPQPSYPGLSQGQPPQVRGPAPAARSDAALPRPDRFWQSNIFTAVLLIIGLAASILVSRQLAQVSIDEVVPTEQGSEFLGTFVAETTNTPTSTFAPTSTPVGDNGGPIFFDRVLLAIDVRQRAWVRITVDGDVVFEGLVEPNTVLQYEGRETVEILTGNGDALEVTYNGQKMGKLGERGEVVKRIYTVQGAVTPTYTPTITNTPTGVPSPTPHESVTPTADN